MPSTSKHEPAVKQALRELRRRPNLSVAQAAREAGAPRRTVADRRRREVDQRAPLIRAVDLKAALDAALLPGISVNEVREIAGLPPIDLDVGRMRFIPERFR